MSKEKNIFVTQPFLPPLEEFNAYVEQIWENKWLTNNGELHQQLEKALAHYLGVPFVSLFANGTIALLTALQALDPDGHRGGEVITTPFTFVATPNALVWNKTKPVFVDVEDQYCNLDPAKVEAAITDKTVAIMPVHVYGNPCDNEALQAIADKHGLKLIYDAAHAFGVRKSGESILNYGDLSVLSFHATKVFNTFEGGAIVSHSEDMKRHIDDLKNFGFRGEERVVLPGINGKMSEVHAAMGLAQLRYMDEIFEKRRSICHKYMVLLDSVKGVEYIVPQDDVESNAAYFPVFINADYPVSRNKLYDKLKKNGIYGRRYFYPLVSDFEPYKEEGEKLDLPVAHRKSEQVICLPLYPDLPLEDVERICKVIKNI